MTRLRFNVSHFLYGRAPRYCMNASRSSVHAHTHAPPGDVRIMAKTIANQMRSSGYDQRDVIALATELIGLVSADMAAKHAG